MKKVIALLLAVALVLSFAACSESEPEPQEPEISEDEIIEGLVADALIKAINKGYPISLGSSVTSFKLNSEINAGSCKMSIGTKEKDSAGNIHVYGTLYPYDKYGNLVKAFSSSAKATYQLDFEVQIPSTLDDAEVMELL